MKSTRTRKSTEYPVIIGSVKPTKNLQGKKYGRLTVIRCIGKTLKNRIYWECLCNCETIIYVSAGNLNSGYVRSCGCLNSDIVIAKNTKHNSVYKRIYYIWHSMIQRCHNPKTKSYKYYGAKGIKVCKEWKNSAKVFIDWAVQNGYSDNLTINRRDSKKGYFPENVNFMTMGKHMSLHANLRVKNGTHNLLAKNRKPDRQKLIAFANDILEVHIPELKSKKAIKILHEGQSRLDELHTDIKEQAQGL